eukprot:TRINITY_DN3318_c7_g1_i1.p1 TRINITY_DN3318_c7_g1~~TRINITY_DN3318_c7_g1_i1.p1  ORF type:complete len:541 (+),score=135.80 TRINITY_DN3318_c7_g1_i1:383-2005(+)
MAVKVFDLTGDMNECVTLLKEVKAMKRVSGHPNIVHCHDSMFDKRGKLCIVMEFMSGGTLSSLLKARDVLSDDIAPICVKQILEGVAHLHSQNIFHRDLKGENILVKTASAKIPHLKLADFGNSKMKAETISASLTAPTAAKTLAGTALWMAPEVIKAAQQAQEYSAQKADIWSLGIVSCEVLQRGKTPWGDFDNPVQALFTIGQWAGGEKGKSLPPGSPKNISQNGKDFLKKCMYVDPQDRPTASQLLKHKWMNVTVPAPTPLTLADLGDITIQETSEFFPVNNAKMLHELCTAASITRPAHKPMKSEPDFIRTATWTEAPPTEAPPTESDQSESDESVLCEEEEEAEDEEYEQEEEEEEDEEDAESSDEGGVHISALNNGLVEFQEVSPLQAMPEKQFTVPGAQVSPIAKSPVVNAHVRQRRSVPVVTTSPLTSSLTRSRGASLSSEMSQNSRMRPLPDDNTSVCSGSFSMPSVRDRRNMFEGQPGTPLGGASRASTNAISPTTPPPRSPGASVKSPGGASSASRVSYLTRQFEDINI